MGLLHLFNWRGRCFRRSVSFSGVARPLYSAWVASFQGLAVLAAWLTRRPLVIHEQNAAAGLTNRLLARLARVVLQAFPGSFNSSVVAETVGNPVREDIAAVAAPADRFNARSGPLRLLVLGGSQGALALNTTVPAALAKLRTDERPVVRHQCGARTLDTAQAAYAEADVDVELVPFIDDMAATYAWADLVVCRAGALTVAELCAVGLPALFVPYPAAVDDHQTANARPMADAGAAVIIDESMLSADVLAGQLREWLSNRQELLDKAKKAACDSSKPSPNCALQQAGSSLVNMRIMAHQLQPAGRRSMINRMRRINIVCTSSASAVRACRALPK